MIGAIVRWSSSPAGVRPDLAAGAIEEPTAQVRLEAADGFADAWLGDLQPLGGAAEVQLFGEGQEDAELTELDGGPH